MILAVTLYSVVLAVHIAAVVVAFGVTFAYPVIGAFARRHPEHLPFVHRMQAEIGKKVIVPGLVVIVLAGIYLASKTHAWSEFYVGFALVAAVVLGGLGGAFFGPQEVRAGELAERDVQRAGPGTEITMSAEYEAVARRIAAVGAAGSLLVLVTVYVMTVKPFA